MERLGAGQRWYSPATGNVFQVVAYSVGEGERTLYGVEREGAGWDEGLVYWWVDEAFQGMVLLEG